MKHQALAVLVSLVVVASAPATSLAQSVQDEQSQLLVSEAKRALAQKEYERAGNLLDRALREAPRRLDLYILRASIYGITGDHNAAIALLERARELAPTSSGVLAALGIQLIQTGRAPEGVPLLERIVAVEPARYAAQVVLGHHYAKHREWSPAVKAFTAYFAHRPSALAGEDAQHRLAYANATLRSGDPRTARTYYQKLLAADKGNELARLGVGWASAAINCKTAMPVLEKLSDLEAKYAQVSLVRGRCALMLRRLDEALARAERYRKAMPESLEGWLLLGDVRIAQRNWKEAEAAYARAATKQPNDQRLALKLAHAERMLGKYAAAEARLRKAGAPQGFEEEWTIEYGEVLLAVRKPQQLRDLLAPWVATHENHAKGTLLYGSALYHLGDHAGAVPYLERSVKAKEPRAPRALSDALNALAAAAAGKNNLAEARRLLEQALAADANALTIRNLGAVLIAQSEYTKAIEVLERDEIDRNDEVGLHLLARAYHGAKRFDDARAAYHRSIKQFGKDPRAVTVMRDLANAELAAGRSEEAVDVLDQALAATPAAQRKEIEAVRLEAARAAATDLMRNNRFSNAVRVLKRVEKSADGDTLVQVRCDMALAATGANQRDLALDLLRTLERTKARCPFVAPADELAVPILIAWNKDSSRARKALDRLEALRRKASGVAEPLLRQAAGDIALRAAADAYAGGNVRRAASYLTIARTYDKRSPELAHNLAVVDLSTGSVDSAISALVGLVGDVPEARINLGIAYEKKGEPLKALSAWKQAAAAGSRYSPLKDWIEAKERFWGTP